MQLDKYKISEEEKDLISIFYQNKDEKRAVQMANYMRNQFLFLGIPAPKRRELSEDFFKKVKISKKINWDFLFYLWDLEEREFQILATDYLKLMQKFLTEEDIPKLKTLVTKKSWWDTIDSLDRTIGNINYPSEKVDNIMLEWSKDNNFWLRRIAIDHQLLRKDRMNVDLLEKILINNFKQKQFFINKAMGWILRDYSKTDKKWVINFLEKNKENLSSLTIREASKYI